MGDPQILRVIERELRETGLDPARVIFEITETAAIANIAKARDFADELAKLGCCFALDDFGAGFGSFYYLKHVHFDILKIDGEFVRDACGTRTDRLVIQSVVAIARGLGKQTVAEHVGDEPRSRCCASSASTTARATSSASRARSRRSSPSSRSRRTRTRRPEGPSTTRGR